MARPNETGGANGRGGGRIAGRNGAGCALQYPTQNAIGGIVRMVQPNPAGFDVGGRIAARTPFSHRTRGQEQLRGEGNQGRGDA